MKDEIKTGEIPNCKCHQRIAQLEGAIEALAKSQMVENDGCPESENQCCYRTLDYPCDDAKCIQCWIDWAMEAAKR